MDDLSRFCRLNSDRSDRGKCGTGNLSATSRYGSDMPRLIDSRLASQKIELVVKHIAEGLVSVRPGGSAE